VLILHKSEIYLIYHHLSTILLSRKAMVKMEDQKISQIVMDWTSNLLRVSMHDLNHFVRSRGLSMAQMNVLLHLYYQGPSEVMNFCDLMQISPAGASQMIERLVQQDLVERTGTTDDRRVRMVVLSEPGKKIVEDSISSRQRWVEELVSKLTEEEKSLVKQAFIALNKYAGDSTCTFQHGRDDFTQQ